MTSPRQTVHILFVGLLVMVAVMVASGFSEKASGNPVVVIKTSMGDITVELFKNKAPKSVENFLAYAESGYYNGTIFHRVIKGFMIQGGGFTPDMNRKPTKPPIQNEANNGLRNTRGALAMARTSDINSATSQFFINTVDNTGLDFKGTTPDAYGYAVLGKVIAGMDVVDKIEKTPTGTKGSMRDVPVQPVVIESVKLK